MSYQVATALAQMGWAATESAARGWEAIARHRGATEGEIAAAWADWRRLQTQQVQIVGHGRCKCSHHATQHGQSGECWSRACGCRDMRPAS